MAYPRQAPLLSAVPTALMTVLLTALLLGGCATPRPAGQSYVTLLASPDGSVGRVLITGRKGQQLLERVHFAAPLDGSAAPAPVDEDRLHRDFAEAMAARPELPQTYVLYFESGLTQPRAESQALLPQILANAARRASADLSIIGHTDSVGRAERNQDLSLQRAQAVAEWLQRQGLRADALSIESQGQEQPQVPTPNDRAEPLNRRVEVIIR
jgi:peptidoglycan-associated lipoprotein